MLYSHEATHHSNGTISAMDIIVDPRVRVLSVEGGNLKRWDVAQGITDTTLGKVPPQPYRVLFSPVSHRRNRRRFSALHSTTASTATLSSTSSPRSVRVSRV